MHRLGRPHRASRRQRSWRPADATRDSDSFWRCWPGGAIVLRAQPAAAQQTLNFSLGYFTVRGEDARVEGDVLNENRELPRVRRSTTSTARRSAANGSCRSASIFEAGAGRRASPGARCRRSTHDFVDTDGSEIEQDLRLRLVPVAFTVRVLPLGQASRVQPYFGGGLAWSTGATASRVSSSTSRDGTRSSASSSSPSGSADRPGRARRHPLRRRQP